MLGRAKEVASEGERVVRGYWHQGSYQRPPTWGRLSGSPSVRGRTHVTTRRVTCDDVQGALLKVVIVAVNGCGDWDARVLGARRRGPPRSGVSRLSLGALGVVFGDIGTSPLYALKTVFSVDGGAVQATPAISSVSSRWSSGRLP